MYSQQKKVVVPSVALNVDAVPWSHWTSHHPDKQVSDRQQLEYKDMTGSLSGDTTTTGLCSGLLRLAPNKELPLHWHPEPLGETYYFVRGNGDVRLGAHVDDLLQVRTVNDTYKQVKTLAEMREIATVPPAERNATINPLKSMYLNDRNMDLKSRLISPGLWVNIPAGTIHGIHSGDDGCEFVWTFRAAKWREIPYLFADPKLADLNLPRTKDASREEL